MLAALAIVLLIFANAAPGSHTWTAAQHAQSSVGSHASHHFFASVGNSVRFLREQLHNTWLFVYVFLAVWSIVVLWALLERRRLRLAIGRREVNWMGWMSFSVVSTACLYGIGTNGVVARRYPRVVSVSDALALGFVLALPMFAWVRMQKRQEIEHEAEEPTPTLRPAFTTTLGLSEAAPMPASPVHFQELQELREEPIQIELRDELPQEGIVLQSIHTPSPTSPHGSEMIVTVETPVETPALPVVVSQPQELALSVQENVVESNPVGEAASSEEGFREHLQNMNESWERIERSGKDIEQWFDAQRRQVISRLEKHPGARKSEAPLELSKDFLTEKLAAVDADWAAIRRSAREISRWFGDLPPANG